MAWKPEEMFDTVNQERKAALKAEGKAEFLTIPEGVTIVNIDTTVAVREIDGDFGKRKIFRAKVKGDDYDLPVSFSLAKKILKTMTEDKTTKIQIIRAGEGKQTRYSVKKA